MMTEDSKTYVFDSAASKGGVDASTLLAMMNSNGGFGNGGWMWIIFLFFLYGWGGRGFGNGSGLEGLSSQINNDYGRDLLMQAINGNRTAISELSTNLNCDINAINTALGSMQNSITSVGNTVGLTGQQVINAIQSGNQAISSQLAQCCCDNKLLVTTQGYENRIAIADQTAALGGKIDSQTTFLSDKFCALEKRELQNKIDTLREETSTLKAQISNANQTAQIQAYIGSVVSPLAAKISEIECKIPGTVTIPYSPVVGVPSCVAAQYGLGLVGNGSIWS